MKEKKGLSRYRKQIVFLMDLFIVNFVYFVMIYWVPIRNGTLITEIFTWIPNLTLMIVCLCGFLWASKSYDSLWRYAETDEYISLIFMGGLAYVVYFLIQKILPIPKIPSVLSLCIYSMSLLLMMTARFIYRKYRMKVTSRNQGKKVRCAIIGAGNAGVALLNEMKNNVSNHYQPVCFFDDDPEKVGKFIHGIEVKGKIDMMPLLLRNTMVTEIIFAIPSANPTRRKEILEMCSTLHCHVKVLPDSFAAVQSENLTQNVRNVKIDDLLGRERVVFNNQEVFGFLQDKVIMVTGGGGSIGSELCRQIAKRGPKRLIVVDIYENNAYDLQQELKMEYGNKLDLKVEIASVRDREKVRELVGYYRPQIIFHAAAHKHVPLMEECPEEAVKNNVFGTYNVVHAADEFGVDKFVLISTDKAVNPTNVMGATKRFCEMILQSMKGRSHTEYAAVRFGNVLGSNGSVIPLFRRQIEAGGPVTITDKRIIRYFMTIPEAAQLVLEAGAMAGSSEVFVLDMGQPVKILDLAENLIKLSGYVPYVDIDIVETGLRPGEKLYEELLMKSDGLMKTTSSKIFIERQQEISQDEMDEKLDILHKALQAGGRENIRLAMKQVVPTYRDPEEVNCQVQNN
ncbi:MAG: nucleoside-diphosphate sugar epimerase/dehydratase [Negativibacillus sp.]|nr:nucleoside-diphosphate sugar epimerase/dehydratase [Negativibacillus sp.]